MAATRALLDQLLNQLRAAPEQSALFLDFDGVLAPIVARPEDAYPPSETRGELARLARTYGLVAIVSGRATDDVRARIGVDGIVYVGSHGLELDPEADRWRQRIADFSSAVAWPAAEIENKGLSVAFHFRSRPDEAAAVVELETIAEHARDEGLTARFGRKVLEVLPPVGSNKGTAVRRLLGDAGLSRALVAGDDTTDLDAFRAVDSLEHKVRVAVVSEESPTLLTQHAELVVSSTGEFLELLHTL